MKRFKRLVNYKERMKDRLDEKFIQFMTAKSSGIDGLLVTVGLCIIALVLCVVMKKSLSDFITKVVEQMQLKALGILDVSTIA